jgi:hypothetical protein
MSDARGIAAMQLRAFFGQEFRNSSFQTGNYMNNQAAQAADLKGLRPWTR